MSATSTANELRKAAEYADGYRGQEVFLVYRPDVIPGDDRRGVIAVLQPDKNDTMLCTLQTPFVTPNCNMNMTPIDFVEARSGDIVWQNLAERAKDPADGSKWNFDSLFWSEAAIEKFLVPYYASFFSKAEMDLLHAAYTDPQVFALGHRVPTIYTPIGSTNGAASNDVMYTLAVLTGERDGRQSEVISLKQYARRSASAKAAAVRTGPSASDAP
jgi:hypothetical protein